ncbi:Periplasmic serine endoprotease DegP precursor [Novipirellula artificiosorum]|uniref:Periplasmic serine endoprotease DegP n=2 Tax=Novipirellula artificiosorum TaxID=2528016 RepID=A0A5C6DDD3_9BACT|nr:Periplasmic serine endoprotease DegP precursor [Novipirellula artificiosorum]
MVMPVVAQDAEYRRAMAAAVRATAQRVLPSIVVIEIVGGTGVAHGEVEQDAPTSGVVVDSEGHILASNIVIRRPSATLLVMLPDGTRHAAKVVAKDHHRDLVLLKIDTESSLAPIDLPAATNRQVGQTVVAVGRYGADASPLVSRGVLSGEDRLDGIALQADARVSPSFYGGVLVDLYGNPLGVLIPAVAEGGAEDATSWYDSGIAFAIPFKSITKNLDRLRRGENIEKGLIGIVAKSKDPYENDTELAAIRVRSPAELAGLKAGDRVVSVAGEKVRRQQEIRQVLGRYDAGDSITIKVLRDDQTITAEVSLADSIPPLKPQRLGITIGAGVPAAEEGEVVIEQVIAGSPADGKLKPSDVVQKVGEVEIREADSLRRQMIAAEPEKIVAVTVKREGVSQVVPVTPETIGDAGVASLPESWTATEAVWTIDELKLPDAANLVAVVAPGEQDQRTRLGLLILLLNPGETTPKSLLEKWTETAEQTGVVVCAIAPESNQRWQPKEIDVIVRFVASVLKTSPIDSSAVAVAATGALSGRDAEAADSMALAVAMSASRTFYGVAVSAKTRPPAVRLRENDAEASLQVLLPMDPNDEPPTWVPTLRDAGYPVISVDDIDVDTLLRWVRLLQAV